MGATSPQLATTLTRLFDLHRHVFWYDEKQALWTEFDALDPPGVAKIVLAHNTFGVKHRTLLPPSPAILISDVRCRVR